MTLPTDSHVHSQWSWDTGPDNDDLMRRTCRQAVRIGLASLVFTEHLDFETSWRASREEFPEVVWPLITGEGYVLPPPLRVEEYFAVVDECRHEFPELMIMTGVEWGQPHLTEQAARSLVDLDRFDRVIGSLHTLATGDDRAEPYTLYREQPPAEVIEAYFAEVPAMAASSAPYEVFTHLDYAVRGWPSATAGPFDPHRFEDVIRAAMGSIAASGRALELNTRRLALWLPLWWREEGGRAISFGSDAHRPDVLAHGFGEAMIMAEHVGFRPGRRPQDYWTC